MTPSRIPPAVPPTPPSLQNFIQGPSVLGAALALAAKGFKVFPLSRLRTPLIKAWPTEATTAVEKIATWWATFGDAAVGIGIACGASGIVVVDVDPRNGGDASLSRLLLDRGDEWVRTVTADTPRGGHHLYFAAQRARIASGTHRLAPGIDVKARGGYVVAPPSVGEHGLYRWQEDGAPGESPLRPLPDWLLPLLKPATAHRRRRGVERVRNISYSFYSARGVPLSGATIQQIVRDEEFASAASHFLGIPDVAVGEAFSCVIRAGDEHPSAALWRDRSGLLVYHDFHAQGTPAEFLTLTEVYAAQITGRAAKLNPPTHLVWLMRLLVALDSLDAVAVALSPLPAHAFASVRTVYDGYTLLLSCRWLYAPGEPAPFTVRFAADWCGVSHATAARAIPALIEMQVIAKVGATKANGKTIPLYLPVATERRESLTSEEEARTEERRAPRHRARTVA